ncbi:glycerophosphodiester phosphodiesterase family protein [Atopobium fossor]|uniref:glycerophosphodiester phosphodiesterase family protein n=1 Tax=Atopobium fossor TaxID=39487 RepID=UPI0004183DFD|nr:glycerophosphodiester phosphodiesterase family protein [Atopobium fossor]
MHKGFFGNSKSSKKKLVLISICLLLLFMFVNNTNAFTTPPSSKRYSFLAHRGLAQTFDESQTNWNSNTATMIDEPVHDYIENTIPSIQAAFDLGATAVEFDVKLSKDGQLALFHDATLQYRCGVKGEVQDYTMSELKQMDVGFGYTADGGKTYPLRGKGVGLMPTINEVFNTFPDKEFVIEVKDGKMETYEVLWKFLSSFPPERLKQLSICCANDQGADYLRQQNAELKIMSKNSLITALITYELIGWTGYVPSSMQNTELRIPLRYARFLWGWPHKFMERMEKSNTRVELTAGKESLSEGFDTVESTKDIPDEYSGLVWTNKINEVNPATVNN